MYRDQGCSVDIIKYLTIRRSICTIMYTFYYKNKRLHNVDKTNLIHFTKGFKQQ